jgi:Ca-activated chloride channel family protein
MMDASGAEGQYGDACEYMNACDPGLFCAGTDMVPGCVDPVGCCSDYCDLGDADASATCEGFLDGQVCLPWYEEGTAPDGLDHVGACALPDGAPDGGRDAERRDCPDTYDPVVLYMSNDDSNSQASPILARRRIREGMVIYPGQIRIHEFLNYYDLSYDNPEDVPARVGIQMRRTSVERGEFTLLLYAQGHKIDDDERPPFNLVFSLDTSGSMSGEPIELLKESMRALAGNLRDGDVISMVTWNHTQSVLLDGLRVTGPDQPALVAAIEGLQAGGSTDLHSGLVTAYQLADAHRITDGINRVVLISDGGANTGITDIELIASEAEDEDGEGTYLVGVGVGSAGYYHDALMDEVTDAGKGAYLFIDEPAEAERMFGRRFLANVAVAARDVRMELTMPWYFGMKSFHGEEYSPVAEEVEPQHLAPNDAMSFHQIVDACDPSLVLVCEEIKARVDYKHPITREPMSDEVSMLLGDLVRADATQLRKADAIVSYAKSLIVIGSLVKEGRGPDAVNVAANMRRWLRDAAVDIDDVEIAEIADLMSEYYGLLRQTYG